MTYSCAQNIFSKSHKIVFKISRCLHPLDVDTPLEKIDQSYIIKEKIFKISFIDTA